MTRVPMDVTAGEPAFHAGEIEMQRRAGIGDRLLEIGPKVIRDAMPEQHRQFFRSLPTLVVGSVDADDRPWASMLAARPGFIQDLGPRRLRVDKLPDDSDVWSSQLAVGAPLGLLGLEPQTRRRNRLNGHVVALDADGFEVEVDQSFGNCPQYIQARTPDRIEHSPQPPRELGRHLDAEAHALVASADTLFIASATPAWAGAARHHGVDVSHRGGKPGFVRVDDRVDDDSDASVLTIPDFRGNFYFNTLGNLLVHPKAGLLFFDPDRGDVLQLTGDVTLLSDGPELRAFAGAHHLLRVRVERAVWRAGALPLRWSAAVPASQLAGTGAWAH